MAFSPYLSERTIGCYKACPLPSDPSCSPFDPACTPDACTQIRRDRWNVLRDDPCQRLPTTIQPCGPLTKAIKDLKEICIPPVWGKYKTRYMQDFKFPKSHNDIDDCCKAPCPCVEKFPELPGNLHYRCTIERPCEPMDTCTTYKHFYIPHPVQPKHPKRVEVYDPCPCPMERCTITRTDYTAKEPIPTGPALSEVIKHGVWSTDQFCKEFTDETTSGVEYGPKCAEIPAPIRPIHNLRIPNCASRTETENREEYVPKPIDNPCFPSWISNDQWYAPETNLESCTTYNHFYKPYPIALPLQTLKVGSPGAIPFSTLNPLWYSCFDPKPNQKTPVEARDNDPWPYVKPCPYKYQDNLQTDPCAVFCDETTTRTDYPPKALCRPTESFAPSPGNVPPLVPFNDNTIMKMSYPAYNWCQYQNAFGNSGNPNGIDWGPFRCPPAQDKCLPRFPAPYGHPLKPYLTPNRCPCGPFDNRSTYNTEYTFRSPEVVQQMEVDRCREPNVPKGISLSRHDYVRQGGKKAEVMPPPDCKGYRCMHPCERRDTDTLYRIDYHDFWKSMERRNLELYRGHPTIRTRRQEEIEQPEEQEVIYTPVCVPRPKPPPVFPLKGTPYEMVDFQAPEYQRCREIPYSGEDILNRAKTTEVCSGYQ